MLLEKLILTNFRNYQKIDMSFTKGLQFLIGNNGAGKTNILEAISLLSSTRSFRGIKDDNLIKWEKKFYTVQGFFFNGNHSSQLSISYQSGQKKKYKINNEKIDSAKDYFGKIKIVTFLPEDMLLVSGYPIMRRKFLDNLGSQINLPKIDEFIKEKYLHLLINYYKLLKHRNHLLKTKSKVFEAYNKLFIEKAALISLYRLYLLSKYLFPEMHKILQHFNNFDLDLSLSVNPIILHSLTDLEYSHLEKNYQTILDFYKKQSATQNHKERILGTTLFGPHRDDINVTINNEKAKNFLSQGQKRIISIAMKLAELQLLNKVNKQNPIVLIDDITNELDQEKTLQIIKLISQTQQCLIAATDEKFCHEIAVNSNQDYAFYKVENNDIKTLKIN